MFTYNALLTATLEKPAISAVICLERWDYRNLSQEYAVYFDGRAVNTFTYQVIKLWDYEEDIAGRQLKELVPLLILLTREKNEEALATVRDLVLASPDAKWQTDALSIAITVAARYFPREFLLKFFREELKVLQEASIVQDWINEGIEKGLAQGLEKGRKQGKLEGEVEALQGAILDILEDRFGMVKKGIGKKLAAIDDPAVLWSLLKRSVKVESLEEFARLLEEV